jgi:hypothetical protein
LVVVLDSPLPLPPLAVLGDDLVIGREGTAEDLRGEVSPRKKVVADADAERNGDAPAGDDEEDDSEDKG